MLQYKSAMSANLIEFLNSNVQYVITVCMFGEKLQGQVDGRYSVIFLGNPAQQNVTLTVV
jgi:hypothetical protein